MGVPSTTLAELQRNAAPPMKPGDDATELGFFNGPAFALTYRVAKVFSESTLVPKHYQGNPGNAMIALNMAQRLGADPLMVMQNLYVVHGTPSWSAQFLIATVNKCGRFSSLRYKWSGTKGQDDYGCTAHAVELATGEVLEGSTVTISLAKKEGWHSKQGSKWQTMPEQMLMYRAAAWFVRAYAPEIAMGLQTAEETLDAKPNEFGVYESVGPATITTEAITARVIETRPSVPEEDPALSATPPETAPEEPWNGVDPPTMPKSKRKPIDEIDAVSGECWDLCKQRNLPMDEMLAEMFPGVKKDKLTLEQWQKFRASLVEK